MSYKIEEQEFSIPTCLPPPPRSRSAAAATAPVFVSDPSAAEMAGRLGQHPPGLYVNIGQLDPIPGLQDEIQAPEELMGDPDVAVLASSYEGSRLMIIEVNNSRADPLLRRLLLNKDSKGNRSLIKAKFTAVNKKIYDMLKNCEELQSRIVASGRVGMPVPAPIATWVERNNIY